MRKVSDWMTRDPQTIGPYDSALGALERMDEGGFRHLPVLNPIGAVVGIVSLEDLKAALPFEVGLGQPRTSAVCAVAQHYRIADLMTYLPAVAHVHDSLEDAARQLMEQRIGCLPVVERDGGLVGIFTETDALRALLGLLADRAQAPARSHAPEPRAQLEALVGELRAERARIGEERRRCEVEERALGAAQHGEPLDPADRGALTSAGMLVGSLAEFAARRLVEIDAGLQRVQQGRFGRCAACGQRIPVGRLRALPSTELCVHCAESRQASAASPSA